MEGGFGFWIKHLPTGMVGPTKRSAKEREFTIVTKRWRSGGGSKGVWGLVNKWVRMGRPVSEGKWDLFAFI